MKIGLGLPAALATDGPADAPGHRAACAALLAALADTSLDELRPVSDAALSVLDTFDEAVIECGRRSRADLMYRYAIVRFLRRLDRAVEYRGGWSLTRAERDRLASQARDLFTSTRTEMRGPGEIVEHKVFCHTTAAAP